MKLKNSYGDNTQKLKLWQNAKTQIVTKLKKNILWQNSKPKNVKKKKVEFWQNLSCEKTQIVTKLKLGQKWSCDKTQIGTKLENLNYDKTKKNSTCDKTWNMKNLKLWEKKIKWVF